MANELYLFPGQPNPNDIRLRSGPAGGGTSYTLTGGVRALTLTGQSATLTVSRVVTGGARALTLTGQSASLVVSRTITAGARSLSLTGQSATLTVGRVVTGGARALTLTGQAATLTYVPATVTPTDAGGGDGGQRSTRVRWSADHRPFRLPYDWHDPVAPSEPTATPAVPTVPFVVARVEGTSEWLQPKTFDLPTRYQPVGDGWSDPFIDTTPVMAGMSAEGRLAALRPDAEAMQALLLVLAIDD